MSWRMSAVLSCASTGDCQNVVVANRVAPVPMAAVESGKRRAARSMEAKRYIERSVLALLQGPRDEKDLFLVWS